MAPKNEKANLSDAEKKAMARAIQAIEEGIEREPPR
jgi:hypothetical protein